MASGWVVFLNGTGQSKGSLLDQVQKIEAFALITLGQVDHQTQIGGDHLILGSLATTNHDFFSIAVLTVRPCSPGELTAIGDTNHRLNFSA